MKKSKKILALLLAVLMVAAIVPMTAFAATSGDWKYSVNDDGTVRIEKYTGSAKELEIPSKIDGRTVTRVETSVGLVFSDCTTLKSVTIPNSVTSIGNNEFSGCTSLNEIIVDKDNTTYSSIDGVLFTKDKTELIRYPEGKTGKSYQIPNSVKSINWQAFQGCTSLTNVTIPNSVIYIMDRAFRGCTSLANITIPNSVEVINGEAFQDCTSLTNVTIPNSVRLIVNLAFRGCKSLREIVVDKDNATYSSIDGVLFSKDKTKLIIYPAGKGKSYQIPNSVTSIVEYAFQDCASLTSVTIPDSVTEIGWYAFNGCTSLASVTIPNSVKTIGGYAFQGCTSLKNVEIGKGVTTIVLEAFVDCTSLKSVTIPKNVTRIGKYAFGYTYEQPKILKSLGIETYGGDDDEPEYKIPNFTIYGEKGTAAEKYAKDNGFKFIEGEPGESKPGDISGDGVVGANDAVMVQRYVAGFATLSADQLKVADMNKDGLVDEGDAVVMLRIDAGLAK